MNVGVRFGLILALLVFTSTATITLAAPRLSGPMPSPASGNHADLGAMLAQADAIKIVDLGQFTRLLDEIGARETELDGEQKSLFHFLRGWRATWVGDYGTGKAELDAVADTSSSNVLRARATATLINLLGIGHRYEEAFTRLTQLQDMLPSIRDRKARFQALGEASQMLSTAGQFDQAEAYAQQMMDNPPPGETICKGAQHLLRARREGGRLHTLDPIYQNAIDSCVGSGDEVFADAMRSDIAAFHVANGHPDEAVKILVANRDALRALHYPTTLAEFDGLLAQAYLKLGDLPNARRYGISALADSIQGEFTDPRRAAYEVLYQVEERLGNATAALSYHEQYMAADKAYLNDLSARSLAFQIVDQQLVARKAEVEALNKQNEILRLNGVLDRKEVETGRLYIFILGLCLLAIAWLVLWLRRSQMRFMKLARRDGLTGICNREHFVEQADRVLAYGARSDRGLCVILFDLDHFKNVNDTYGHAVGDEVLKRAVDVCHRALHACDVFGRLGGEEFAILLPDCSPAQARARAEQLRLSISATSATQARPELAVTASFGVSSTLQCGFELHRLLVVADAALYRAKRAGRNCVFMGDTGDIPDSPYLTEARG
ncbi:diguanylate cyclase (GGDEF)-like protein [Luteibacter sp. OK325]|jgi:diguanylate cyclase (GGDEF)-like protein|uniref:GGDEF domain-containing protein n=1 Tax=Luteibacter sp. OK325 TaxID=2135670 RepID=UPI000D37CC98|nr:GGDEF domain-containing protein [Luteibacter sp. OK325]PTR30727.1 diguanylate cyclase (GGDEF)-like protein [Luteibacter sp. OK325]